MNFGLGLLFTYSRGNVISSSFFIDLKNCMRISLDKAYALQKNATTAHTMVYYLINRSLQS